MLDHGQMDWSQVDLRARSILVGELLPMYDVEINFIVALSNELLELSRR